MLTTHAASGTKLGLTITLLTLFFITSSLQAASFENMDKFTGSWAGIVTDKNDESIRTIFEITKNPSGVPPHQFQLIFKTPRSCRLQAEELLTDDKQLILKFYKASGGFCDKLYKGQLTLDIKDKKTLSATIERKSKNINETATLKRQ